MKTGETLFFGAPINVKHGKIEEHIRSWCNRDFWQ